MGVRTLDVKVGERLLEIGFGNGHGLVSMARSLGGTGIVYGIDSSQGMLEVTWARLRKTG